MSESLRKHVRLLGATLGEVIGERVGDGLIDRTEALRVLCKRAANEGDPSLLDEAARLIAELDLGQIRALLRAYTAYFRLVNQAEQDEVVRINRERARREKGRIRPESIDEVFRALRQRGYSAEQVLAVISRLDIQPTLTAHPTEARRLTMLYKLRRVRQILARLRNDDITPDENLEALNELHTQVTLIAASDEIRAERPTVADEVEQGLYFLRNTIWDTIPWIQADLRRAFVRHFDAEPELPVFLRYRSWIGGDRDGNPNVTAEVTKWTLDRQRDEALQLQLVELRDLRRELSLSPAQTEVPRSLYEAIERDAEEIPFSERDLRRFQREPYRMRLTQLMWRLERLREGLGDYRCDDYIEDLELIRACLRETGFARVAQYGHTWRALLLARTFGFHMTALDIRQHSRVHGEAMAAILESSGVTAEYASMSERERLQTLTALLDDRGAGPVRRERLPDQAKEALGVFDVIGESLDRDPASIGGYIVSMTHSVSALLEPMVLARLAGLWRTENGTGYCPLDIVPLFETIRDLEVGHELLGSLLDLPSYARHLDANGGVQEIMLGYSDSNKDGGYVMANWALHQAQHRLGDCCRRRGIDFRLFHGRGGSIGRGGGRANQTILAMPPVVQNGRIRFTEQGEVISFRYAEPEIAHRHLEQIVDAMIHCTAGSSHPPATPEAREPTGAAAAVGELEERHRPLFARMSALSMDTYRALVECDDAWQWYLRSTPIELISKLPIASRPAARGSSRVDFESLRAIPWGFAWVQTRYLLPGWFGIGRALTEIMDEDPAALEDMRTLYRTHPFFQTLIDNARRELARCRFEISERYSRLAGDEGQALHEVIREDFELARAALLAIIELDHLIADNPVIRNSIDRRNPYTDVLNLLQIELLRRHHDASAEERQELRHPLLLSLNGISAAMQTTG